MTLKARLLAIVAALAASACATGGPGQGTVIDRWAAVRAPAAPPLEAVTVDPKTTCLLVLDMQNNLTDPAAHPNAHAAIARIEVLLKEARSSRMLVVYSNTKVGTPADIVSELAPLPGEPVVRSSVDKFYRTDLERILLDSGIKTVIVTGTAANGAVMYTATGAAMRGLKVVVPVDAMPADSLYAEQYVAWHLLNSPGTRAAATLTRSDLITF